MEKLGVTASELFVNNPYRVLGLPVNATAGEVEDRYETLIAIAVENNGSLELNGGSINFNGLGFIIFEFVIE